MINNTNYKHLPWDSDFFGFNVAHLELGPEHKQVPEEFLDAAAKENVTLLTVAAHTDFPSDNPVASSLVDTPTVYELDYAIDHFWKTAEEQRVEVYEGQEQLDKLYALAAVAGVHSRYYRDPLFPKIKADALFKAWVDRALEAENQIIHVAKDHSGEIFAMLISRVLNVRGRIVGNPALLAVEPKWRGQSFTREFCVASCNWFLRQGITQGYVVTQGHNNVAKHIYESLEWEQKAQSKFYHIWLKN